MAKTGKKKTGRPPYQPTDMDRGKVIAWAQKCMSQARCAKELGIDVNTFKKYYKEDYNIGHEDLLDNVEASLFHEAIKGRGSSRVRACEIILKTQRADKWKEKQETTVNVKDVPTVQFVVPTSEEMQKIRDGAE